MIQSQNQKLNGIKIDLIQNRANIELAKKIFETIDKNRRYLTTHLITMKLILSPEDVLECLKLNELNYPIIYDYGIYKNNNFIGEIKVISMNTEDKIGNLHYWISEDESQKGYITEAVSIIENEFFLNQKYNKLHICCNIDNFSSAKVAQKRGFTLETIIKKKDTTQEMYLKDLCIYSKTNPLIQ